MVRRLEALADAFVHYSEWDDPSSDTYQSRNPGNLKAFTAKHLRNLKGKRVFGSLLDGYQALLYDLAVKCTGNSNSGLKPSSSLRDLVCVYGHTAVSTGSIAKFLRKALEDPGITETTPLSYFVSE